MSTQRHEFYVTAPIDKFGRMGLWIRHLVLKYILDGTPILLILQNNRSEWRTRIMSFFSFLGTEDCFTCLIPLLTWILDARLGWLFTILVSIGFYTVGFLKSLLCLPRPPSPPVIPLHNENGDWAFPSNHGTVALLVPGYLWTYACSHYDWPWHVRLLWLLVAVTWVCGVTLSRLYLGVHSVADMAGGTVIAACILAVYLLLDDYIESVCVDQHVVPKALLFAIVLMYVHPRTNPETSSYGESVMMLGVTMGLVASRAIMLGENRRLSLLQSLTNLDELPQWTLVGRSVARFFLGTVMIVGGRFLLKAITRSIFFKIYSYFDLPAYNYKQYAKEYPAEIKHYTSGYRLPPLPSSQDNDNDTGCDMDGVKNGTAVNSVRSRAQRIGQSACESADSASIVSYPVRKPLPFDVDIPSRFIVYSIAGWILGEGAPALFQVVGI